MRFSGVTAAVLAFCGAAASADTCDAILGEWQMQTRNFETSDGAYAVEVWSHEVQLVPRHGLACQFIGSWLSWRDDVETASLVGEGMVLGQRVTFHRRLRPDAPVQVFEGRFVNGALSGMILQGDETIGIWQMHRMPASPTPAS